MIAIINYGVGNLQSVLNAFKILTEDVIITSDKKIIENADRIVLPGVGAFGKGMNNLKKGDFIPLIYNQIEKGKPFLGICLGMQLCLSESEEMGHFKGLDLIKGNVVRFKEGGNKIPQIGWNNVYFNKDTLFKGVPENSMFYFVHSYYVQPSPNAIAGTTFYNGINYCSAIEYNNIFATQFHPEKSGPVGLKVLENFINVK
ncbi:MAG: imidazole glycerol phosphate synthase subunit HisH [Abditibacteriota bacterium]|nr:imidazole glycerol phosphate synthase subunit HisH [Abditibacteriota bacterium]